MRPRALTPSGIILVDKPAGPSSFAIVAAVRRRTGARTGHAGTLDPFATGLLLLLSGAATKLQPRFVGLHKRYLTEIDLAARTTTGDPDGDVVDEREPLSRAELEERLGDLRGIVELPVPAASAVKIGGERAYRLHRRGVAVEMPVRRSHVHELTLRSEVRRATYQSSIRDDSSGRAHCNRVALLKSHSLRTPRSACAGSHHWVRLSSRCHCRSLRRTAIGPFSIEEADDERIVTADEALARL